MQGTLSIEINQTASARAVRFPAYFFGELMQVMEKESDLEEGEIFEEHPGCWKQHDHHGISFA